MSPLHTKHGLPRDRYFVVHLVFFLGGVTSILPFNVLTTAIPYFIFKIRNQSLPIDQQQDPNYYTDDQKNLPGYLTLCSVIALATFNVVTLVLTRWCSVVTTFVVAGILNALVYGITIILNWITLDAATFFWVTILCGVFVNAFASVLQGSILGLAAIFPMRIMTCTITGQSAAGVLAAVVKLLTLATASTLETEAIAYFSSALTVLTLSVLGVILSLKTKYVRYFRELEASRGERSSEEAATTDNNLQDTTDNTDDIVELGQRNASLDYNSEVGRPASKSATFRLAMVIRSLREVFLPGLCVFLSINMTLIAYPTLLVTIVSTSGASELWTKTYFIQVILFLSFNVCDWIGRFAGGLVKWPRRSQLNLVLILCGLRYLMIPVFMLMNQQPRKIPAIFKHDAFPIIFIIIMGLTNGYIVALGYIHAPSFASPGNTTGSGVGMVMYLTLGLATGVAVSTGLSKII